MTRHGILTPFGSAGDFHPFFWLGRLSPPATSPPRSAAFCTRLQFAPRVPPLHPESMLTSLSRWQSFAFYIAALVAGLLYLTDTFRQWRRLGPPGPTLAAADEDPCSPETHPSDPGSQSSANPFPKAQFDHLRKRIIQAADPDK